MNQPDLGLKVSELRQQKGLVQEKLAEYCEVSAQMIQRIENDEVKAPYFPAIIASGLDISVLVKEEPMTEKTKNRSVWCDNGHQPIQMIYSDDEGWEKASIYICSLCQAEKMVKESPWNGKVTIEWKKKPKYPKVASNSPW